MGLFLLFMTGSLLIGILCRRQQLWVTGALVGALCAIAVVGYFFFNQI